MKSSGLKLIDELSVVSACELRNRLRLDDHIFEADEVGAVCTGWELAFVLDGQSNFACVRNSSVLEFESQRSLVNQLKKTVPELAMDFHGRADNRESLTISLHNKSA